MRVTKAEHEELRAMSEPKREASLAAPAGSAFPGGDMSGVAGKWKHDKTGDEFIVIAPNIAALRRVMESFGETCAESQTRHGRLVSW